MSTAEFLGEWASWLEEQEYNDPVRDIWVKPQRSERSKFIFLARKECEQQGLDPDDEDIVGRANALRMRQRRWNG